MARVVLLAACAPLLGPALGLHPWSAGTPPAPGAGPTTAPAPSAWVVPLPGPVRVTRRFSAPATPYAAGHRGVDLAGRDGEAVRAAGAGVVTFAGAVAGVGVVTVAHGGGLRTTYEPVTPVVSARWRVRPGDVIATLGSGHPDCPAAACLHWGLLRGTGRLEAYLDPLMLLGLTRPRLLPLVAAVGVGGGAA